MHRFVLLRWVLHIRSMPPLLSLLFSFTLSFRLVLAHADSLHLALKTLERIFDSRNMFKATLLQALQLMVVVCEDGEEET